MQCLLIANLVYITTDLYLVTLVIVYFIPVECNMRNTVPRFEVEITADYLQDIDGDGWLSFL